MPHQFDRLDVSMFVSVSVCTMKLTTRCIAKVGARETTSHDYNWQQSGGRRPTAVSFLHVRHATTYLRQWHLPETKAVDTVCSCRCLHSLHRKKQRSVWCSHWPNPSPQPQVAFSKFAIMFLQIFKVSRLIKIASHYTVLYIHFLTIFGWDRHSRSLEMTHFDRWHGTPL